MELVGRELMVTPIILKLIRVGMLFAIVCGILLSAGSSVYATEVNNSNTIALTEQQQTEQAIESLKFYLEEAGHVDPVTKKYIVTDFNALKARAELSGDEGLEGKFIFENFVLPSMNRNLGAYAACVVLNSVPFGGIIWDALQGRNLVQILINALQAHQYDRVVSIIKDIAAKMLKSSQFAKFNVVVVVASVALNAISCWGT